MIPWVQLDSAKTGDGAQELRLKRRGSEFSIMLGTNELMNSRLSGSEEALARLSCQRISGQRISGHQQPRILIGGLGMGYYLKRAGIDSFTVYEKAGGLGGVWRENTYPGAACDVPSHLYSFSFDPHYPWSSAFGPQREILDYQQQVARKHGLLPHIRFNR